ncbi:MAG: zinc carboxypeptidase [Chitinophagaceae bacterium]|nr:MAG: zinc carboxypeptidase [Chitinophagaceae bacterium]
MRKSIAVITLLFAGHFLTAQDLSYYLPKNVSYNSSIPTPESVIYHKVGEWHVTHDRLTNYMAAIAAAAPQKVKLQTMGFTYEQRPQTLLIISSPKNIARLEEIRQQHLLLSDPARSSSLNIDEMPIVVYIGHSIHGNEPSGSNAALLTAYYLAAAEGKEVEELLEKVVVLFDPSFNPDGLQRFSTWANQHKSKNLVTDPNSREFNEVWPGGRFNHYWFDLNRDWLPGVHPESRNRIKLFHDWKPNILTDHHEQGSNASFFFQPGVPSRVNPLTPAKNQELTAKLGKYHAKNLDEIGSLYFSKENYDDFYYGKGSTFPDINGAIGILFEQASSRGHAQETSNGILSFPFTIRNQFVTALSTLQGAKELKKEFLDFQRDFYRQSTTGGNKAYVFGDKYDLAKTNIFIEMMLRHNIIVNEFAGPFDASFEKGKSFTVSLDQPQQVLIKAIFDKQLSFTDSLFYDISSWTMPLAFGIPYKEVAKANAAERITASVAPAGEIIGGKSNYAYLFSWDEFYAPKALYELQNAGIITKLATNTFEMPVQNINKKFDYGTILVPVAMQSQTADKVYELLNSVAKNNGLTVYAMQTGGVVTGSDLGSSKFISLTKPKTALLVGAGVNALDAGEVWHLLDQRMNIPASHLETAQFNRIDISKYNTIIMVSGNYNELNKEKLKTWVQSGGNLVVLEEAINWTVENGISNVKIKKIKSPTDSSSHLPYVQKEQIDGAQQMNGSIFGAEVDLTHPLAYGYHTKTVSMFKPNRVFMELPKGPYAAPFYYGNNPLQSGYISKENAAAIKNSAAVIVNAVGAGRVINISENINLRGFWLGGTKLLMNALFFGRSIDAGTARTED